VNVPAWAERLKRILAEHDGTMERALATLMMLHARETGLALDVALECFEGVAVNVEALPGRCDREAVYSALAFGMICACDAESLHPDWTRDRDEAYASVDLAVRRLRRVLAQKGLAESMADLERELALLEVGGPQGGELLRCGSDRSELMPSTGGAPKALWRGETRKRLRAADVCDEAASALLAAAGLLRKPAPKPKRR
jgi:hypothetical protein